MRLVDDIIEKALDSNESISALLRRCLVLAYELNDEPLKNWVQKELNGFDKVDELPEYRQATVISRGMFLGSIHSSINDQPLPLHILNEEHRKIVNKAYLTGPIASYVLEKPEERHLSIPWSPMLTVMYQDKFFDGYTLNRTWQELPPALLVGLIDTVRNRVLEFALKIRDQLGPASDDLKSVPKEKVAQYVKNIIYGGQNVIASQTRDIQQISDIEIAKGDFAALSSALKRAGASEEEVTDLKLALDEDAVEQPNSMGHRVASWLQKAGVKLAGEAGTGIIVGWILHYLGLS